MTASLSRTAPTRAPKVPRAPVLTEKDEERRGDAFMAQHGYVAIRFSQARASQQTEGIPDRRYYHAGWGHALWWEAKRKGGKQRTAQAEFQAMCSACGEEYVVGPAEALIERMTWRLVTIRSRKTFRDDIELGPEE